VYILRCGDGTLYTGATSDVGRRLRQHRAGRGARYTRSRLPLAVVYLEGAHDRGAALRREAAIKQLTRAEKLTLIRSSRARAPR
jgi:predicted GIY-YIG superfamily endonuclease